MYSLARERKNSLSLGSGKMAGVSAAYHYDHIDLQDARHPCTAISEGTLQTDSAWSYRL